MAEHVLVFTTFALQVDHLGLGVPLLDANKVELLRQEINLILLFGSELVMRLLDEVELL